MKYVLSIIFLSIVVLTILGFYIRPTDPGQGNLFIGLGISGLFFVWMPIFLYHNWKGKDVNKYLLSKENIKKMQNHRENHQNEEA